MDHGDVVQVSGISEEEESAETAHYLQMNWTHGEHGDCQTVSVWQEETGVWSGKRSQKTVSDPGPMSVSRRPLSGSTALTDAAVCSF